MNLIPFSFYSLSREKHRNIIKVLRYRALFDDYENDCLNAEEIVIAIDGIREGYDILNAPAPDLKALKAKVKEAKGDSNGHTQGGKGCAQDGKNKAQGSRPGGARKRAGGEKADGAEKSRADLDR